MQKPPEFIINAYDLAKEKTYFLQNRIFLLIHSISSHYFVTF
jgi:hypothetical protein